MLPTKSRTRADLFQFLQIENDEKVIVSFRFFQISAIELRNPANFFYCYADAYMYLLRFGDVTPSYVVDTKTDACKVSTWRRNGAR